jgi:hypothetical protein
MSGNEGHGLQETLIKSCRLAMPLSYREAVATSSPMLPLGGYVGYRLREEGATP